MFPGYNNTRPRMDVDLLEIQHVCPYIYTDINWDTKPKNDPGSQTIFFFSPVVVCMVFHFCGVNKVLD